MNLGFMEDFGSGLSTAAKYGSQAYKYGKQVAPYAGEAWNYASPSTYETYAKPATENFLAVKDFGKAQGGWNAVDQFGHTLSGTQVAPVAQEVMVQAPVVPAQKTQEEEFAEFLAWKAAQGRLILLNI